MKAFQRKKPARSWWYSRAMLLVLFVLVGVMAKAAWSIYLKERDSHAHRFTAEQNLTELTARTSVLEKKIAGLKTPEGIEAEIRAQFQVIKPGERMVMLGSNPTAAVSTAPAPSLISRFFDIFR